MKKIVFLDAATVDYGDLDMSVFALLGEFTSYPVTTAAQAVERMRGNAIVITNKVVIDSNVIAHTPGLEFIALAATGFNTVDLPAAQAKGILTANVPGYSTTTVAQLTMTFILNLAMKVINYHRASVSGEWSRSEIFTMGNWPTCDLEGKTLGIMGMGAIGKKVADLASAFGMNVIALKREGAIYDTTYERVSLLELAHRSDFISVHLPLTPESTNLINRAFIATMKKTACLINMARGPIVNSHDLAIALNSGLIAGAALDVLDKEPPPPDHPLLTAKNIIITPHIAWASIESRTRLVNEIALNIKAFLAGQKRNIVG